MPGRRKRQFTKKRPFTGKLRSFKKARVDFVGERKFFDTEIDVAAITAAGTVVKIR